MPRTHAAPLTRRLAITAAALAAAAGAPATLCAQPIAFDNTCGNFLWANHCLNGCDFHNNWNTGFTTDCVSHPASPQAGSDVTLGNFVVINNGANPIRSLVTSTHFINRHVISVSSSAVYNGPVTAEGHFVGGTHVFNGHITVPAAGANSPEWGQGIHHLNAGLTIAAGGSCYMDGDVTSNGPTVWNGDGLFYIDSAYAPPPGPAGGIFRNVAGSVFTAAGNGEMRGVIGVGHFLNAGTFIKSGGAGTTTIRSHFVHQPGASMHVDTGTLSFRTPEPPSSFAGPISIDWLAKVELVTGIADLVNLNVTGDGLFHVTSSATARIPAGTTTTMRHFECDGLIEGGGDLIVTHSVKLTGTHEDGGLTRLGASCTGFIDSSYTNYGGPIENNGSLTWTAGYIGIAESAPFTNTASGVFEVRCDALPFSGAAFTNGTFNNHGRFGKYAGPGETVFTVAAFNNHGTVEAASGNLRFDGGFNQYGGVTRLIGGSITTSYPEYRMMLHGGALTGTGQILGHVRNAGGVVKPGNSAGVITLDGGSGNSYVQDPGGTLEVEIGGAAPAQYDRLIVNGPVTLAGTLRVVRTSGFTGTGSFDIITFAFPGLTGAFTNIDAPPGTTVQYLADRVRVHLSTPTCPADLGVAGGGPGQDGALDNNDFIAFINYFFNQHPIADMGIAGGLPGSDGQWDNNDFIAFINAFFAGCA